MSGRSGLDAQLGVATEETYGTYKAPTRFFPFESESMEWTKNFIESTGLRAGRYVQPESLHVGTTKTVGGGFEIEFFDKGMGILLNQLHGETITPEKLEEKSKTVYKQLHKIGNTLPFGKSLTVQVGRPDASGTTRAFSYVGCKMTEFKLSVSSGGFAMVSVAFDGRDLKTGEALGSATYTSGVLPYNFTQTVCKVGGSEVANVNSFDLTVQVPMKTDRYNLGSEGLKLEPIVNGHIDISANATLEFTSLADQERYEKEQVKELQFISTGPEIGSEGEHFKSTTTLKATKQINNNAAVGGPEVLSESATFKGLDDGTNVPLTVELLSTDTTI